MNRYSIVRGKNPRELVLLKSRPCRWGRCFFCDYINDNQKEGSTNLINLEILNCVTGETGELEVINSGSVFELEKETLERIREVVEQKNIVRLSFETHYAYRHRLKEIETMFQGVDIRFKCGIESFDAHYRNQILNKGVYFDQPEEVRRYFSSICLLIGVEGQTKDVIREDLRIAEDLFDRVCVNIYQNNTTPVRRDEELITWFLTQYQEKMRTEPFELLVENTDYGVGEC